MSGYYNREGYVKEMKKEIIFFIFIFERQTPLKMFTIFSYKFLKNIIRGKKNKFYIR